MLSLHIIGMYSSGAILHNLPNQFFSWLHTSIVPKKLREVILLVALIVWCERCARIFTGQIKSPSQMAQEVFQENHVFIFFFLSLFIIKNFSSFFFSFCSLLMNLLILQITCNHLLQAIQVWGVDPSLFLKKNNYTKYQI